ncbi:MAG TPA: zf-HC2 domain-containing protein [Blastocatellia bacterium]|nr:zf-HC2 domain-containing protein [Blastocatellia bacterium]
MKCEDCVFIIEEYLDGELEQREAERMLSHLSGCAACANVYESLKQEQLVYARYQRDVEVGPAMWAAIQAQMKEPVEVPAPRRSLKEVLAGLFAAPRLSFAYTVALVLIAVGVTVAVMSYIQSRGSNESAPIAGGGNTTQPKTPPGGNDSAPATPNNALKSEPSAPVKTPEKAPEIAAVKPKPKVVKQPLSPEQLVREAEQKYLSAIAILTRDVNKRRSQLDPAVLAKFENAIASIDKAIDETRMAARKNPDDPIALQYMLAAYSKKVDLLREMARN